MSRSRSQFITCNQCSQRGRTRSMNDSYQRTIQDSYPGHGLHNKRCQLVRPWRHRRQRAVKHGSADGVMVLSALHECWLQSYDPLLSSHRDRKFSGAGVVTCLKKPSHECFWGYVDGKNELLTMILMVVTTNYRRDRLNPFWEFVKPNHFVRTIVVKFWSNFRKI